MSVLVRLSSSYLPSFFLEGIERSWVVAGMKTRSGTGSNIDLITCIERWKAGSPGTKKVAPLVALIAHVGHEKVPPFLSWTRLGTWKKVLFINKALANPLPGRT